MLYLDENPARWLEISMRVKGHLTGPIRYDFS